MLSPGSRIGPYEVIELLGAGGMGEVYRARDARIGRVVALKVLPAGVANDRDRLQRFQREAESAGALNHPNLLTIHELGVDGDRPYIVSELLEGTTLRDRLSSGAIPQRKAADYALQIAEGLAAAHDNAITHRDLKPENIFITRDGRVKILDFGLAKLRTSVEDVRADQVTVQQHTDPGTVLGTAGYMSPEQVRGEATDARSDIFSLGVCLYEMLTGRRAFKAPSSVETMNAILNNDPPDISSINSQISPALQRVVNHCLEKNPEERFQSARDLAFDLESMSDATAALTPAGAQDKRRPLVVPLGIAAAIALMAVAAAFFTGRRFGRTQPPQFRRLTYHSSFIPGARFAPDGRSIVYSSGTANGQEIFMARLGSPEIRALGLPSARILSISSDGEMAILLNPRLGGSFRWNGTLARAQLAGGAPREIATDVEDADWSPTGHDLAIVRLEAGIERIEYPIGNVRYQAGGWISHPRIAPDGKEIAFIDHPIFNSDDGVVAIIGADGKRRALSQAFSSIQGLAWTPDGSEIWFTGARSGNSRELWGVTRSGRERRILGAPNTLTLCDIDREGRVLMVESNLRMRMFGVGPADNAPRELSWLDWSLARDISPDGRMILFDETGDGGGLKYSVYMRGFDGSPAVRLGDGMASKFSPDGRSVMAIQDFEGRSRLAFYPTGAGEARVLTTGVAITRAHWMPDGRNVVAVGHEPDRGTRVFLIDLATGKHRPITNEGEFGPGYISPDSRFIIGRHPSRALAIYPVGGGAPRLISAIDDRFFIAGWSPDGKAVLYYDRFKPSVLAFDLTTNQSSIWKELHPFSPDVQFLQGLVLTPDRQSYVFSSFSDTGDVFLLERPEG